VGQVRGRLLEPEAQSQPSASAINRRGTAVPAVLAKGVRRQGRVLDDGLPQIGKDVHAVQAAVTKLHSMGKRKKKIKLKSRTVRGIPLAACIGQSRCVMMSKIYWPILLGLARWPASRRPINIPSPPANGH